MKNSFTVKRSLVAITKLTFTVFCLLSIYSCKTKNDEIPSPDQSLTTAKTKVNANNGVLMGTIDVDGDGVPDNIYNNGSFITVVRATGLSHQYTVGGGAWALLFGNSSSIVDLDGVAGAEIPVNIGGSLLIINDRQGTTSTYPIGSGSWAAAPGSIADLDGVAGAEIPIVNGSQLIIITARTGTKSSYPISSGNWAVVQGGTTDLDGVPGAEITMVSGSQLIIFTAKTGQMNSYPMGSGSWAILSNGFQDFDGIAGNDIAITQPESSRNNLIIVHPKSRTTTTYSTLGYWYLVSYANSGTNGVYINVFSTTYNKNYTVVDATKTIR